MILQACLLIAFALGAEDDSHQAIDHDAVEAYRAGEHSVALARWDELLQTTSLPSKERARLLYNAGNAAARGGSWLQAVGYYTEALEGAPRDGALWVNLEFARREAGLEPEDRGDLAATFKRTLTAWTVDEARWIALGGLLLLAAALGHEALRGGRSGRRGAWVGVVLALIASAPLALHRLSDDSAEVFVISDRDLAVRSEPRSDAQVLERAKPGTYRNELDRLGDWVGIETSDGAKGWVLESGVLTLPTAP